MFPTGDQMADTFFHLGSLPLEMNPMVWESLSTTYHKPGCIKHILETLEEDELEVLKASSFGKFIELADQSPYFGRLGRFMMSRQLKVNKKYEAMVLNQHMQGRWTRLKM